MNPYNRTHRTMLIHAPVAGEATIVAAIAAGFVTHRYVDSLLHSANDQPAAEGHMFNRAINTTLMMLHWVDAVPEYTQMWFERGVLHRAGDRPAIVCKKHSLDDESFSVLQSEWFDHGVLHRANEPAVMEDNKPIVWANYGVVVVNVGFPDGGITPEPDRIKALLESARIAGARDTACYRFGRLHCIDGPAIVRANGDREWWIGGKIHRSSAQSDCVCFEYLGWAPNAKFHSAHHNLRTPAIEYADGNREWYIYGHSGYITNAYGERLERDGIEYHMLVGHSRLPDVRLPNGNLLWVSRSQGKYQLSKVLCPPDVFKFNPHELNHFYGISADTVYDYGVPRVP